MGKAFAHKWIDLNPTATTLHVKTLKQIPELMEIYEGYSKWEWRFGKTPEFKNSLEHKFSWALVDV